jgi:hypothetical protein
MGSQKRIEWQQNEDETTILWWESSFTFSRVIGRYDAIDRWALVRATLMWREPRINKCDWDDPLSNYSGCDGWGQTDDARDDNDVSCADVDVE